MTAREQIIKALKELGWPRPDVCKYAGPQGLGWYGRPFGEDEEYLGSNLSNTLECIGRWQAARKTIEQLLAQMVKRDAPHATLNPKY